MAAAWLESLASGLMREAESDPRLARYRLRPAEAGDEPMLYALHREALHDYVEVTWGWEEDWQRQYFRNHFRPADNVVVVARGTTRGSGGDRDVGRVSITRHWHKLFLRDIELAAPHRGQGVGTALLRTVLAMAADDGKRVELHVLRCNPAQRLYTRLGFRIASGDDARWLMRSD
jgi:ribosomal protein S18 acetylase RimI-like enzyme